MKTSRRLRWLHRIGYVTTALVALQLCAIAFVVIKERLDDRERRMATLIEPGALASHPDKLRPMDREAQLLNALPRIESLAPDGLRFLASPAFGDSDYAISLRRDADGGAGVMIVTPRNAAPGSGRTVRFSMPAADYGRLTTRLDTLADTWTGGSGWASDGTTIAFERIAGNRVRSGINNSGTFYEAAGAAVLLSVRPALPELSHLDESWHPPFDE